MSSQHGRSSRPPEPLRRPSSPTPEPDRPPPLEVSIDEPDGPTVNVSITVDPRGISPAGLARYIAELEERLTPLSSRGRSRSAEDLTATEAVDRQVERLCHHSVTTASQLRRLHGGLVGRGYRPKLPRSKREQPPPYLSYLDAAGGNLGYLRSHSFTVVRRALHDRLLRVEGFARSGSHVVTSLSADGAVDALLAAASDAFDCRTPR